MKVPLFTLQTTMTTSWRRYIGEPSLHLIEKAEIPLIWDAAQALLALQGKSKVFCVP